MSLFLRLQGGSKAKLCPWFFDKRGNNTIECPRFCEKGG